VGGDGTMRLMSNQELVARSSKGSFTRQIRMDGVSGQHSQIEDSYQAFVEWLYSSLYLVGRHGSDDCSSPGSASSC
jgi:hypothetical protein